MEKNGFGENVSLARVATGHDHDAHSPRGGRLTGNSPTKLIRICLAIEVLE